VYERLVTEIQYSGTTLLLLVNPCRLHQNNSTVCPNYRMKRKHFIATHYTAVRINDCLKKNLCNQSSHYENYRRFPLWMEAITCLPHFLWWAKMNGTQRRALVSLWRMHCVQRYGKRYLSGWSDIEQWKNQPHSLSYCQIWRHHSVRQLVSQ